MAFKLGFIGGGNMSTAIVQGILKKDAHPASDIWVSGPRLHNLNRWKELGTNVTTNNGELIYNCDVVFLGVKPHIFIEAIEGCVEYLKDKNKKKQVLFISMLAGTTLHKLNEVLRVLSDYVTIRIIRTLPNMPMAVGAGACPYVPGDEVTQDQCLQLEKLLERTALCEKISESVMNSLGALTACGPAFIYIIIEALADGAVKSGVPRATAIRLASQMVIGSGQMVLQSGKHPGLLKDEVCSPGGATICGVAALENAKIRAALINAMDAAVNKMSLFS